jgi:multiple sugar transport system permease protein
MRREETLLFDLHDYSVGLATMQGEYVTNFPVMMAGTVIASWPVIALFTSLQRYFVRGIAISGVKG